MKKTQIFVRYENHFDLTWRRCWKKPYEYQGLTYRPYADVEEAIISRCLSLSEHEGAAFQLEQALTLREYLRKHPDKLELFRELQQQKRFALLGAGEAIIDTNMCSGETLVRNYVSGARYAMALFGVAPKIANHNDGFGSSAQFPQIMRGCGMKGIEVLSYSKPDGPYWRGLDGSTVLVKFEKPGQLYFYDHCYYEPCLDCKGRGKLKKTSCKTCEGTGLRLSQGHYPDRDWIEELDHEMGQYVVYSEEMLPDVQLPALIRRKNKEGGIQYRWGSSENLMPLWKEALARVDDVDLALSSRVENNPTQTGTLVSRIRVKQAARRAESAYFAAEKLSAILQFEKGGKTSAKLESAWLNLPLLFFHDAVTGTHNDPAAEELLDVASKTIRDVKSISLKAMQKLDPKAKQIENGFSEGDIVVFNPLGFTADIPIEFETENVAVNVTDKDGQKMAIVRQPLEREPMAREFSPVGAGHYQTRDAKEPSVLRFVAECVAPFSFKQFTISKQKKLSLNTAITEKAGSQEIGDFRISWDQHGVNSVYSFTKQAELLDGTKGRAGTLIVEDDVGDPWGTREINRRRTDCQGMQTFHSGSITDSKVELVFAGRFENNTFGREKDPSLFGLEWNQKVIISRRLPWIEFHYDIFWQAVNRRIRIAFPSKAQQDRGLYSIPYGAIWRDRYEMADNALFSPNGDWPALYYAATTPEPEAPGIAVINTGTPSARIEDGVVLYSVLRSPGFGHCLFRYSQEYPMPTAEIRDGGFHQFRFGLMPFDGNIPEVHKAGEIMNAAPSVFASGDKAIPENAPFSISQPGVFIESVKTAFKGGISLRVVEMEGRKQQVDLSVPQKVQAAFITDMLEENGIACPMPQRGLLRFEIKPHQIITIVIET